jgi:hypothetical protein
MSCPQVITLHLLEQRREIIPLRPVYHSYTHDAHVQLAQCSTRLELVLHLVQPVFCEIRVASVEFRDAAADGYLVLLASPREQATDQNDAGASGDGGD